MRLKTHRGNSHSQTQVSLYTKVDAKNTAKKRPEIKKGKNEGGKREWDNEKKG